VRLQPWVFSSLLSGGYHGKDGWGMTVTLIVYLVLRLRKMEFYLTFVTCLHGVLENGLQKIFVAKEVEMIGGWKKLRQEELQNL
jgi:hypothetical protein